MHIRPNTNITNNNTQKNSKKDLLDKLNKEKSIHLELQERIDDLEYENRELRTLLNLTLNELLKLKGIGN